jgi:hypothetical protein
MGMNVAYDEIVRNGSKGFFFLFGPSNFVTSKIWLGEFLPKYLGKLLSIQILLKKKKKFKFKFLFYFVSFLKSSNFIFLG